MTVERNKQRWKATAIYKKKTVADYRADHNNYSTYQPLSYVEISTLHIKYPK
jgi:hypothetical protein